jgi:acetolactate synthase small subunit
MALAFPEGSPRGASVTGIHHLELDVLDDPTVLLRVVSVCHQRQFRITFLRYDRSAGGARLLLGVEGGSTQLPRLEHWLANLIHVLAVRAHEAAVSPAPMDSPEPILE